MRPSLCLVGMNQILVRPGDILTLTGTVFSSIMASRFRIGCWRNEMRRAASPRRLTILILSMVTLLGFGGSVALAQQIPSTPDPVAVNLDASSTAVIVNDVNEQICRSQPNCIGMVVP